MPVTDAVTVSMRRWDMIVASITDVMITVTRSFEIERADAVRNSALRSSQRMGACCVEEVLRLKAPLHHSKQRQVFQISRNQCWSIGGSRRCQLPSLGISEYLLDSDHF